MRIGIVDLDTSHPGSYAPRIAELGHTVVAVVDGETVVDRSYVEAYAAEHGIEHVVETSEEMLGLIDAAFVHSVNWDTHVARVRPFVEAGIPVKICKPFAGNAADIQQLVEWADAGAVLAGGSALRWSASADRLRKVVEQGDSRLYAATYGHVLDYGIHAFSLVHGAVGPGMEAVPSLTEDGSSVQIRWKNGMTAVVDVLPPGGGYGFYATVCGQNGVEHLDASGDDFYGTFLKVTLDHLSGVAEMPLSFGELVEPELAIIGARASSQHDGDWISLREDVRIHDASFDGAGFARTYAETRREALGLPTR